VAVFNGFFEKFLLHEAGGANEECLFVGGVDGKFGGADTDEVVNIDFMTEEM